MAAAELRDGEANAGGCSCDESNFGGSKDGVRHCYYVQRKVLSRS